MCLSWALAQPVCSQPSIAAEKFDKVLILEKQPDPGRKLLLTGSGQCNFTNIRPIQEFHKAYGDHGHFLKPALFHFTNQDTIAFFKRHGVESVVVEENGKVFPKSRQAHDILNLLLSLCEKRNVEIRFRERVTRLNMQANRVSQVYSATREYQARNVVMATGGKSYPGTGSTGDGYSLAQSLGHSLVPPRPGLTPFYIKNFSLADLTGISFKNLKVTLWHESKKLKTLSGDLLLTHRGISGPVVHNLARFAQSGDSVTLSFVPFENAEEFKQQWLAGLEQNGRLKTKTWLKKYQLPGALVAENHGVGRCESRRFSSGIKPGKALGALAFNHCFSSGDRSIGRFPCRHGHLRRSAPGRSKLQNHGIPSGQRIVFCWRSIGYRRGQRRIRPAGRLVHRCAGSPCDEEGLIRNPVFT